MQLVNINSIVLRWTITNDFIVLTKKRNILDNTSCKMKQRKFIKCIFRCTKLNKANVEVGFEL